MNKNKINENLITQETLLNPSFEEGVKVIEDYSIEAPQEVMEVCEAFDQIGGRGLLVGGSVRDAVISAEADDFNLEPKDFDIEVYGLSPEELYSTLCKTFVEHNINSVGREFGVIKVKVESCDEPLDFSIPRRDNKTGKGHNGFTIEGDPTMGIKEAAKRRDLTINTLAYDPLKRVVYDSYSGVEDIKERRIEITDIESFQEDPLRVLRIMQFASRFNFEVSKEDKEVCKQIVKRGELSEIPASRVTEEFIKLFVKGKSPSVGLNFLREVGITERYFPELHNLIGVPQEEEWHPEGDVWNHTLQVVDAAAEVSEERNLNTDQRLILTLSALCHDLGKPETTEFIDGRWRAIGHEPKGVEPAKEFLNKFEFGNSIKRKVLALVPEHMNPKLLWLESLKNIDMSKAVRRLAVRLDKGDTNVQMLALLAEADQRGRNGNGLIPLKREDVDDLSKWQDWLLNKANELKVNERAPEPLIGGNELIEKGIQPGPNMGVVLKAVFADQLDGVVRTEQSALEKALGYYELIKKKVKEQAQKEQVLERDIWHKLVRYDDPRVLVSNG